LVTNGPSVVVAFGFPTLFAGITSVVDPPFEHHIGCCENPCAVKPRGSDATRPATPAGLSKERAIMHLVLFLLFGLVVGIVARWIVPGNVRGGWVTSMTIGVLGALFGGFLGRLFGLYEQGHRAGFVMSVLGAVLLVGAYHALARRPRFRERYR
jgi:uncharacterized membrane protein YeaQ/YmgE (transglycosylase-associated protein family)